MCVIGGATDSPASGSLPVVLPEFSPSLSQRGSALHELIVETDFAAAHRLREHKGKCEALHGHNWKVQVRLRAHQLDPIGMVMDFKDVKATLAAALDELDHHYLNDDVAIFKTVNPTTENISKYLFVKLSARLPEEVKVAEVTVWESDRCGASYREE